MDKMHETFENWFIRFYPSEPLNKNHNGSYESIEAECAYQGWKACDQQFRATPTAQDSKVPEGFVLAPKSATPEMIEFAKASMEAAGFLSTKNDMRNQDYRRLYHGMLSAAPSLAEKPDHAEHPLAMVAEKPQWVNWTSMTSESSPHGSSLTVRFDSLEEMQVCRKALIGLQRPEAPENL